MGNKQVQIHIEKIKLLYQNSLIPIVLSGVAGLFLVAHCGQVQITYICLFG